MGSFLAAVQQGRQEEEMFFFEKKNQKTFALALFYLAHR